MVSYAQNREDVLLNRIFADQRTGFYIDVGAWLPVLDSVTKHLYERGWRGINTEPVAGCIKLLCADRPRDINLAVGLSNHEGTMTLYETSMASGGSTFSAGAADELRRMGIEVVEHTVPVTTLARVCEQYALEPIDLLKIDVEGHERQVLEGADWGRWRPRVVVIEATVPMSATPNHEQWEHLLLDAGYLFATFDGLNRFYVRPEDQGLAQLLHAGQRLRRLQAVRARCAGRRPRGDPDQDALRAECHQARASEVSVTWTNPAPVGPRVGPAITRLPKDHGVAEPLFGSVLLPMMVFRRRGIEQS
jgi:FkbM family methyltransferase